MLKGLIKEISNNIKPINNKKDDIFIACTSFEDRTTAVVEKLSKSYRAVDSFVFNYDEQNRTNLRDINFNRLMNILSKHSKSIIPLICNFYDPLDGIFKFKNLCKNRSIKLRDTNITIDITTFTKQYLLVLLKFIEKQSPKSIRLLYTEPDDYAVKWNKPLSYGLIDIISVPTYGGHFYIEKENLLILQLGYEGNRAYAIWEKLTPHKTILLIGKPSYRNLWEGRVEEFNKKLISKLPEDSVNYIPTLDPFEVNKKLNYIIKQYLPKFNIMISPLGPKPQVIGCYLAVRKHQDIQIIYAIPKFRNEEYYSKKMGRIWEYR